MEAAQFLFQSMRIHLRLVNMTIAVFNIFAEALDLSVHFSVKISLLSLEFSTLVAIAMNHSLGATPGVSLFIQYALNLLNLEQGRFFSHNLLSFKSKSDLEKSIREIGANQSDQRL